MELTAFEELLFEAKVVTKLYFESPKGHVDSFFDIFCSASGKQHPPIYSQSKKKNASKKWVFPFSQKKQILPTAASEEVVKADETGSCPMPVRAVYAIAKMDDEEDAKSVSEVGKIDPISELKDSPSTVNTSARLKKCFRFSNSHLILGAVITLSVVALISAGTFLLTQSSKTEDYILQQFLHFFFQRIPPPSRL